MTKLQIENITQNYKGKYHTIINKIVKRLPQGYELYNFAPNTFIAECILDYTKGSKQYNEVYNTIENLLNI